jgi:hypothetical protein
MIATSIYSRHLCFIVLSFTTAFYRHSLCAAFLHTPFLTRSSFHLSSYGSSGNTIHSLLKSKNGSHFLNSRYKTTWNVQRQQNADETILYKTTDIRKEKSFGLIALIMCCTMALVWPIHSSPVMATEDAASATIAAAVQNLMEAAGDADKSFEALKNVADIITDGKGIGGSLSYGKCTCVSHSNGCHQNECSLHHGCHFQRQINSIIYWNIFSLSQVVFN